MQMQMQMQISSIFKYLLIQLQFFFCDNSITGPICNDLLRFMPWNLQQKNRHLTTANVTGHPVQEVTIKIHIANDDGKVHFFPLEGCIYHPYSPVNVLSTRRLAEKCLYANGNPDEETRIEYRSSTHTLTCCYVKYKKTFPTLVSSHPELMFDEGFTRYNSYCRSRITFPANCSCYHWI